ncbi:MAG: succinate-semialdehyde dehydrogenase [Melioribacteraceae bacterium]|nr:MAG: succinate-semialdehyde dehydrogenase [Melioribacteraceae bacterium]
MALQTINPATNELVKNFDEHSEEEVKDIINKSHETYLKWRKKTYSERAPLMKKAAEYLRSNKRKYAETLTLEMGKPITQAIAEVEKCAFVCDYYADNTENILAFEPLKSDASKSYVRFDPIGIVLAVMPWNFPFWQVFRFAAPALMAGNTGILKHASNVPMSALAIEEVFREAGFPEHAFRTLLIGSRQVEAVVNNPLVKATTLTGSEVAGQHVAGASGKNLKKSVMELGGSDPFIILEDAELDEAIATGVKARLINNGQSCIAAKRFIVVEKVYDQFEKAFKERMEAVKIGDPMHEDTELGPMAREDLMLELHDQVKKSVEKGARVVTGGAPLEREGVYYPATILADVVPGVPAYHEELFGPVAIVIKARDEADAIHIANDTDFGLGSSIWTKDTDKAQKLAGEIDSGSVFINGMVKSDPRLPFGGVKISGYGRELSHYGIKEFVNIKTVWVK